MKKSSDKFDDAIKGKLDQIKVEYNPKSWDLLEQKLGAGDQPPVDNQWLDEVVFEKMHGFESQNTMPRWDLMSARLDQEIATRRQFLRRRFMEAVLVLLILFTFVQYFGEQTPGRFINGSAAKQDANDQKIATLSDTDQNTRSNLPATSIPTPNELQNSTNFNQVAKIRNASQIKLPGTNIGFQDRAFTKMPLKENNVPTIPGISLQQEQPSSLEQKTISLTDQTSSTEAPISQLDLITALDRLEIMELKNKDTEEYPFLISPVNGNRGFYVSMFGSLDYNHIVTPPTMVEGQMLEGFDRYELGYGGGIMAHWEMDRLEIGTGVIYSAKEYTPRPVIYLNGNLKDGYYGEGFKFVELNMLQLPFNVRYNVLRRNKWRAYATAGLSLHLTLQANFYVADEKGFDLPLPTRPPSQAPGGGVTNTPIDEKASILTGGILEGGSIIRNSYATGNLGVGIERFVTERWSIFTQPTYQYSLKNMRRGIGPDQDRINTMSIFMGVRVKL